MWGRVFCGGFIALLVCFHSLAFAQLFQVSDNNQNTDNQYIEEKADTIPIAKVPDVPLPEKEQVERCLRAGTDFLLSHQAKDGSWGDHTRTKGLNVICPYPEGPLSFRLACTSLCVIGLNAGPFRQEEAVKQAIERARNCLITELPKLKRGDTRTVLSVWGHAYGLEALCALAKELPKDDPMFAQLRDVARLQITSLDSLCDVRGGWGYYTFDTFSQRPIGSPTSFLSATVLLAYRDAKEVFDLDSDPGLLKRSLKFLKAQRTPAGTYVYSVDHTVRPALPINRHTGSLARTPACDLTLISYDPKALSMRQFEDGLERLWSRSGWLSLAIKKPIPHESFAQNAGYFFYYGYYYAARCFDKVPQTSLKRHASQLAEDILPLQETDGSWWDYPLYNYHKFYGTGYALYSMARVYDVLKTSPNTQTEAPATD